MYTARGSPAFHRSSALQHFKHSNAIAIRNRTMFDFFYPGTATLVSAILDLGVAVNFYYHMTTSIMFLCNVWYRHHLQAQGHLQLHQEQPQTSIPQLLVSIWHAQQCHQPQPFPVSVLHKQNATLYYCRLQNYHIVPASTNLPILTILWFLEVLCVTGHHAKFDLFSSWGHVHSCNRPSGATTSGSQSFTHTHP